MTSTNIAEQPWLYFKLYLGESTNRADQMLVHLADMIGESQLFSSWFYIRYFDESGMHFRVRLLPLAEKNIIAKSEAEKIFSSLFERLKTFSISTHEPMVVPPGVTRSDGSKFMALGEARWVKDTYEPEYEKYGGIKGVGFAEKLFMASSVVAISIMQDEFSEFYSRKTMVPCLMRACHTVFKPASAEEFWNRYCIFWLGGDSYAASDWQEKFFRKFEDLQEKGVKICLDDSELHPKALSLLNYWRNALAEAKAAYDQHDTGALTDVLCFNFTHLMNNRLGMTSLEEPYMATLLQHFESRLHV